MKTRHHRGYLLIEVVMAGGITTAAVLALLVMLAGSRTDSVAAARDVTAQGLLKREIERVRAMGYLGVTAQSATVESGLSGQYSISRSVVSGNEPLFGSETTAYRDVTVTVSHPDGTGTKSYSTVVRLYE